MNKLVFASVISEIQQSDVFMTVKARICEAPKANLNGARVTEAFIDDVVDNEPRYVGLPLYADVRALTNGNYRRLGHLYDSKTGEFHSTQIGSFYQFEKEKLDDGCALIGYARIPKRNKKLSKAISELFADGALKFSFEVAVGEYEELDDDTILIDASDSNYLEGTAIVTFPACEEAVALELVAQQKDDPEGDEKDMTDKIVAAEEAVKEEEKVVAETPAETPVETIAEETKEDSKEETTEETPAEEEDASCKKDKENAAVIIRERTEQTQSTSAYDTESDVEVFQTVKVETEVSHVEPEAQIVETDDGVHIAEDAGGDEAPAETPAETAETPTETSTETPTETSTETPTETPTEVPVEAPNSDGPVQAPDAEETIPVVEDTRKTAEQLIAELAEQVAALRKEVAELKERKVVAETVTAEVNPFIEPINATKQYSLLEKTTKGFDSYSLLGKA